MIREEGGEVYLVKAKRARPSGQEPMAESVPPQADLAALTDATDMKSDKERGEDLQSTTVETLRCNEGGGDEEDVFFQFSKEACTTPRSVYIDFKFKCFIKLWTLIWRTYLTLSFAQSFLPSFAFVTSVGHSKG